MEAEGTTDWPGQVHRVLGANGVRQVAFVPDAGLSRLLDLCAADEGMASVPLTSEEEGMGVLAGAWLGGERGVLMMQSSGVGNCVNALSLSRICRFPLLILITMRGEWGEFNPWQVPMGQAAAAALELAGVVTQRPAAAAEIAETVDAAARLAFDSMRAVAVLIPQRVIGVKTFEE
jgi:sulfopyruvate decarboxylase alpha subunit